MGQAEIRDALGDRLRWAVASVRYQWRLVVLPTLVLWVLATFVAAGLLKSFDVQEYQRYANAALQSPLLHSLPREYPAPTLVIFLLPLLLPFAYPWAFAVPVGIVLVLLLMSYQTSGVPGMDFESAGRLIIYLALGEVMILTSRYDIFAVAAAFFALRAARRQRWSAAWTWSSIGFVLKLFPAVLWPVLLIAEWRQNGRIPLKRFIWIVGSGIVIVGLPALFNPGAIDNVAHYYLRRPPEIGSLAAGLSLLDWHRWGFVLSFHTINVLSPLVGPLATALEVAGCAGFLWTWWMQARGRLPIEAACLASLTFVVLGSKVGSIQYVMWLMPFWALYRLRVTWVLACIANSIVFPYTISAMRFGYVTGHTYVITLTLTYLTRDLLIAAGTWLWLREVLRGRTHLPTAEIGEVVDSA
jgi:hypothetical protein